MRYGTVCSGVEAFGPAWEAMGYECAFHAEIATHPSAVLRYHYPDVPNYGDFSQIQPSPATAIDVLCGGTPCQDFSVAGLRKGLAGDRGNLTLEFARLAQRLRPRWLVWENVPGVLSADGGRAFGQFLTLLAECGYYAAYRVLDARHFGVPQRRRRVFLVAHLGDWRPAAAVLFERESLRGNFAPSQEAGAGITGSLTGGASVGGGWRVGADEAAAGHVVVQAFGGNNTSGPIDVATCLTAHGGGSGRLDFESETFIAGTLCASGKAAGSATQQDAESGLLVPLRYGPSQQDTMLFEDGQANTLPSGSHGNAGHMQKVFAPTAAFKRGNSAGAGSIGYQEEIAPTLMGGNSGTQSGAGLLHGSAVRRLTPLECERLMGYPDNWTQYGVKPNGTQYTVADGPRYQMCGNGWATPVANWVAERLMMVEQLLGAPTPTPITGNNPES